MGTYRSDDAEKKIKKDESRVLAAVGPVLQVVVQCLERNPEARLKSDFLERRLTEHIIKFAALDPLHCVYLAPETNAGTQPRHQRPVEAPIPDWVRTETRSRRTRTPIPEISEDTATDEFLSPRSQIVNARPSTSQTTVRLPSPPAVSLDSLSSFHLDMDSKSQRSDTVVARSTTSRDQSIYSPSSDRDMDSCPPDIQKRRVPEGYLQKPYRWEINHTNESAVDPRLTLSSDGSEPGIFTYMNYSTSPSDDGDGQNYSYPLPPSQPPPKKKLPPVPARHEMHSLKATRTQPSKYHHHPPIRPSHEDLAALQQLHVSRDAAATNRPTRISSLTHEEQVQRERERAYLAAHEEQVRSARRAGRSPVGGRHIADQQRVYRHRF